MKLVREYINEKFTEKSDPVQDMGIGVFEKPADFKNESEAVDYVISIMPLILKVRKIPNDIIKQKNYIINEKYYEKLRHYCGNYITVDGEVYELNPEILGVKLYKMGFIAHKDDARMYKILSSHYKV